MKKFKTVTYTKRKKWNDPSTGFKVTKKVWLKDKITSYAWAIKSNNHIPRTLDTFNHWGGNTALALFKTKKEADKWASKEHDRVVKVQISEF